jgi:putative restriction endonuclease
MARTNWTRSELIVAFNLYCKIPFGRIHIRNPEIIALASTLGRTPSAVSWKLANFASLDPTLKKRNIVGATHGGKLEKEVWNEFNQDWERLSFDSETLRQQMSGKPIIEEDDQIFPEGRTREAVVRTRVNQGFFRAAILAAYNSTCCITGLTVGELLCASHIVPWSKDTKNRTNPRNGLCLNPIHDRAFDRGLLTITSDYEVLLSPRLRANADPGLESLIYKYDGTKITVPDRFAPDMSFLQYHHQHIFQR